MGNKMCKKKVDNVDNTKAPSPFDRIITRLHLKRNPWKSDSNLNTKQVNRYEINSKNGKTEAEKQIIKSKSTEWTEAALEVPEKDEAIHLKNPQLSFIFNDDTIPIPPPRKHKKSIREKIEAVAKTGIQALQAKKSDESKKVEEEPRLPADEPICVKKIVKYGCPYCDAKICAHKQEVTKLNQKPKDSKRKKNLSVVSLPNYNELKFSIANVENGDNIKFIDSSAKNSANSLPGETKKATGAQSGKLENYMTRCRSFGSLLNNKLKVPKEPKEPADIESDDSFGGLEDWDLGILEHYNPKDTSLPRPRKSTNNDNVLAGIEGLIVPDESIETVPPKRPLRRSESLVKNVTEEGAKNSEENTPLIAPTNVDGTDGQIEHSSLMRILQEYSIKDAQKRSSGEESGENNNVAQKSEIDVSSQNNAKTISNDFINADKICVS